ncbi:hypothetical protein WKW50_24075, partial [Ochrobactrum sp. GPK 3]
PGASQEPDIVTFIMIQALRHAVFECFAATAFTSLLDIGFRPQQHYLHDINPLKYRKKTIAELILKTDEVLIRTYLP